MAFSREHKEVIVEQYREWIDKSKAIYYLTYNKMTMPAINDARAWAAEAPGRAVIVTGSITLVGEAIALAAAEGWK